MLRLLLTSLFIEVKIKESKTSMNQLKIQQSKNFKEKIAMVASCFEVTVVTACHLLTESTYYAGFSKKIKPSW